jgi:hypothetical protein
MMMAEVYWIHGFEKKLGEGESLAGMILAWLDEIHVRVNWVNQVNVLGDVEPAELLADFAKNELPAGFLFTADKMDEHFFLQQILRRMRMDETESQLVVLKNGQDVSAGLFISHRQVGKYNLLPRLVLAEQMSVLQPQALKAKLTDMPEEYESVYVTGLQDEIFNRLDIAEIGNISVVTMAKVNLLQCLLEINQQQQLKDCFGFLVSQAENQPIMVTSVQGC